MDSQKQNNYKLSVTLVQMTPIYHFQANEAGATLRATEVKPKLDRYLIHAAFKDEPVDFLQFCIGKQSDPSQKDDPKKYALNYRLSITVDSPSAADCVALFTSYTDRDGRTKYNLTGSIWDTKTLPYGTFQKSSQRVTLHFFSRHPALIKAIRDWIDAFFAGENFGRRQSKGFGSFITEACMSDFACFETALRKHMNTTGVMTNRATIEVPYAKLPTSVIVEYPNGRTQEQAPVSDYSMMDVLNDIRDIHRVMKSGYNMPNSDEQKKVYISSYLLKIYAKKHDKLKDFDNEKRVMKIGTLSEIHGLTLPDENRDREQLKQKQRFYRAMLGLPSFYEFRKLRYGGNEKCVARINIADNTSGGEKIARFRSPITYKPVLIAGKWRCYLIPQPIPKEMFKREFSFTLSELKGAANYNKPPAQKIQTPTVDEFDLLHFLSQFTAEPQVIRESVTKNYSRHKAVCNFDHLTIPKEERPNE